MLNSAWSEVLRSDLDKLSQPTTTRAKTPVPVLKEGERRIVTILFLDIQGFTAMSEKLDPEDVQLIIDNCFKILTNEIEKYSGFIDKYEGDRLMALFGSRQASEIDCEQALRAALGMKDKFQEINRILAEREIRIGVRVGVNTGLVVTGRIGKGREQDFTVMGDAVNLASRLETNAPPNEIMISEEAKRSAGDVFLYEDLGNIEVKGKSEPISVFCVKGLNPHRAERWERSPFTQRSGYVGRDEEDHRLKSAAETLNVQKSGVRTFGISAPAGIGKSRLVHEFVRRFRSAGGEKPICLRGASLADHTTPLGILADLIQRGLTLPEIGPSLFSDVPPEQKESAEELAAVVHYLAGQKELDDRMQSLDPQALRLEIHLAVRFVLERSAAIAKERGCAPLFVHLEDLQWIDAASQEALEFLGANLRFDAPIFFIWTYRPEFRWSPELKTQFQAEEIELKPLPQDSCRAILRNVLGESAFPSGEEDLLVRRSGGNPFFMEELIQSLIDDGTLQRENDSWRLSKAIDEAGLPDTINRMILARIDKIRPEHKQVLMAASVVGETIPSVIIQDVGHRMGAEKAGVEIRLKNLHDLGFLYPKERKGSLGSEFAFRHALTRDVVYSTLLNHNKKILHGLAGQAYEHVYKDRPQDHSALLFHHFSRAGLKDKTITYGLMAVDQMVRQYATKEGLEVAQVLWPLLKESGNSAHHLDARIRLTEAEIKLFDLLGKRQEQLKRVESLEEMCRSRSTPELAARAALHRGSYFAGIGDFRQTKEYVRKGLDTCPADGGPSRLRMDLLRTYGIAAYSMGEYAEALKHYEQGLSISKELGERGAEAAFYNTVGLVHFNMGQPREALEYYTRAYEIMDEIGDRRGQGNALGNQGLVYWTLGEYSRALEQLNQSHKIFREIGFRKGQAVTMGNIGVIHHKLGQYTEALRCYETALALRREIHDRAGEGYDLVNIGVVHQHLGNYVKAIEHFEAGEWLAREVGSNYLLSENLNCLGIVYRKLGETDTALLSRARSKVEEALHIALEHKLVPAQVKALSNIGRILWALGEREVALAKSTEAMKLIEVHQSGVEGSEEDAYINHYFILSDAGRGSEAREWLGKLVHLIEDRAARIKEEAYRRSFLEEVRQNRYALSEWRKNPD